MEKAVLKSIRYFAQFDYAPTASEVYTFLEKRVVRATFDRKLAEMVKKGIVVEKRFKKSLLPDTKPTLESYFLNLKSQNRYTLGEYQSSLKTQKKKLEIGYGKLDIARTYITILGWFSQIRLVGISGSVSMLNATETDDVDLFIVTRKRRLWTGRFLAILLAQIMGVRRRRHQSYAPDKVCLNLFFDEQNLKIPAKKRNLYVAHEVLQMKPVINQDNTYLIYLDANKWVFDIFPNAHFVIPALSRNLYRSRTKFGMTLFEDLMESVLKKLQLFLIHRHRTTELISDTQLWFHPDDYEKKLKK